MHERSDIRGIGFREIDMAVFGLVPVGAPPLRLAGADEDDEDEPVIVRGID
ncbi:hypothetical protein [Streptomyces sp. NPDC088785]|uniref:hypothetical protein n=1 Tax=Streptomyces sp. NPDC088785 TaxID=3365897 RepID=UPI00382F5024